MGMHSLQQNPVRMHGVSVILAGEGCREEALPGVQAGVEWEAMGQQEGLQVRAEAGAAGDPAATQTGQVRARVRPCVQVGEWVTGLWDGVAKGFGFLSFNF
eukprot:scaffold77492_cov20-Tisochrysis_lutea.AAC.2